MKDARIRAFSRLAGSNFRTLSVPLLIGAVMYAWAGTAHATPECQNLGAGDPMTTTGDVVTNGNDLCTVTSASPLTNNVDALTQGAATGSVDTLKLDATTAAGGSCPAAGHGRCSRSPRWAVRSPERRGAG